MRKEDCFFFARIFNKFSFKGEVLARPDTDNLEDFLELESVFIDMNGTLVPFFIERMRLHKQQYLRFKFEEVDDEATADTLMKRDIYLPLSILPDLEEDQFYYHEIIGFKVIDKNHGTLGILKEVNDAGMQPVFVITAGDKEVLIPLHDDFIERLDRDKNEIHLNAPEGLIDLYLSE